MPSLSFVADVTGWDRAFKGTSRRLANMLPAHREIGRLLVDMVRDNFDTSGGSSPWPELAPSTLLARARNPSGKGSSRSPFFKRKSPFVGPLTSKQGRMSGGKPVYAYARRAVEQAKPLIWSGYLKRSIMSESAQDYADVGSPLFWSWRLFMGWSGSGPKTPKRFPFTFRPGDAEQISRIYVRHIFGELVQ